MSEALNPKPETLNPEPRPKRRRGSLADSQYFGWDGLGEEANASSSRGKQNTGFSIKKVAAKPMLISSESWDEGQAQLYIELREYMLRPRERVILLGPIGLYAKDGC